MNVNQKTWTIHEIVDAMQEVDVNAMMGGVTEASFQCGNDQIDIQGDVIEPAWEMFAGSTTVWENGHLLYQRDAANVDNYHNETYTLGQYPKYSDMVSYLQDKYQGKSFDMVKEKVPVVQESFERHWENPTYRKSLETPEKQNDLTRIVFADKGMERGYHKVDFAYACDQKTFGQDVSMANPYLMSSKRKGSDGKLTTVHSYYLSESIYQRLQAYANKDGISEQSRWSGVVEGQVGYPASRNGKTQPSLNLTNDAEKKGLLCKPSVPFDEQKHNRFIKASLAEHKGNRGRDLESKYGSLEQQVSEQLDSMSR